MYNLFLFQTCSMGSYGPVAFASPVCCRKTCKRRRSYPMLQRKWQICIFSCLDRQREREICCSNAKSDECQEAWTDIFKSQWTLKSSQRQKVSFFMQQCMFLDMHCCDKSNHRKCRKPCKKLLTSKAMAI